MFPSHINTVYIHEAAENFSAAGEKESSTSQKKPPKLLHNIKGLILDFDGTLFDNARIPFYLIASFPPDWLRIWRERLIRKGFAGCDFTSPANYYRAFFTALGKACHRSPGRIRNWYFNRYMPRMAKVIKRHYEPRPGVQELFDRFETPEDKAGYNYRTVPPQPGSLRLAVYSDYPFLKERMEALGISYGRTPLYGPESFGAQKPAARPFIRIAGDLGLSPEEVLVIGDRTDTDGLGAFNAGMRFFCLKTGHKKYFRLDPYRRQPEDKPQGPSLVMYAGYWDDLINLLLQDTGSR